jgi:hypothetical protein
MLSHVPTTSVYALRTDKIRITLARESHSLGPDVASRTSLLCDVLSRPTDKATENGNLTN